jgi:hypothetical protein
MFANINFESIKSNKMATFRFLTTFLLSIVLGVQVNQLAAKHIIGGEISYKCLGETPQIPDFNRYLVTIKIYRDCDPQAGGAFFDVPAYFSIYRGSDSTWISTGNDFGVDDYQYAEIIPDTPTCLQNEPYVCVETAQYTFTIDLPIDPNNSYMIVYQRCCRNNSIINIHNPELVGSTYSVEITPQAQQVCNNSAVYNNFPPTLINKDIPLIFDHSATDTDTDSLVYRFCTPLVGGGPILTFPDYNSCGGAQPIPPCAPPFDPVPFVQPQYSPTNPMGGNPQITISPITGLITGTPNVLGRFEVGVCVDEYRNDSLVGTTKREFQFNVTDCEPMVSVVTNSDNTSTLRAYPNPANQVLHIEYKGAPARYRLLNLMGTPVREGLLQSPLNIVDTATLPAGVFVLVVAGMPQPVRILITR